MIFDISDYIRKTETGQGDDCKKVVYCQKGCSLDFRFFKKVN